MEPIIQLERATKDYGRGRGVFKVSFAVARGEVVGFLGANGAGKSVTMRLLMGVRTGPRRGGCSSAGAIALPIGPAYSARWAICRASWPVPPTLPAGRSSISWRRCAARAIIVGATS